MKVRIWDTDGRGMEGKILEGRRAESRAAGGGESMVGEKEG